MELKKIQTNCPNCNWQLIIKIQSKQVKNPKSPAGGMGAAIEALTNSKKARDEYVKATSHK